jgi:S-methylmethionine-dependent homocysteine/selenocysteine methylase
MSLAELVPGPAALDGGLATELEARGYDLAHHLWSAQLLASDPDAIRDLHLDYYRSGARVAISASYQASRRGFEASGMDADEADSLLVRSVQLAQQARSQALATGVPGPLLVAASVGPYGAMLNDGSEYRGNYGVSRAELAAFHEERLDVLAAAGPDLLAVETIPDVAEAEVLAGLLDGYDLPAWVSFSCVGDGLTCAGQPYAEACEVAASSARTVAVGVNCSAPQHVAALLTAGRTVTDLPFVVYPNAGGLWDAVHGVWTDQRAKDLPAEQVRGWAAAGALLVGGCCGLGPDAVSGIAAALAA